MIVWNGALSRFERVQGARSQTEAMPYVHGRAAALPGMNRPWGDTELLSAAPAPLDLAHLVSYSDIEQMVVGWLNSPVSSFAWFIDATTTIYTPSWSDVFHPGRLMRFLQQRAQMYFYRMLLLGRRGLVSYATIAAAANEFVGMLNVSEFNLRAGHRSTNRSIGKNLDPRLDLGYTIDPVSLLGKMLAWHMGTVAFSSETSLAMAHFPHTLSVVAGTGAVRASTETSVVTLTGSGNPVRGVPTMPVRNYLRRHVWFVPFFELGTVLTLLLYFFLLNWFFSRMGYPHFTSDDFGRYHGNTRDFFGI